MAYNRLRFGFLGGLLVLLSVGALCVVGLFVWGAGRLKGGGFSFADESAYVKCNGLDIVGRRNIGSIPSTYRLLDKRYTCRGFRGNTPQRVTQITYTYAADARAAQPREALNSYLSAELAGGGWVGPGVETIDGYTTSLHLTREPLIGLSYAVEPSRTSIFQLVLFARDAWRPKARDTRAPRDVVITGATVQEYVADLTSIKPKFVPAGYTNWHSRPYSHQDEFDARNLTSAVFRLAGGSGDVKPEVYLTEASPDQYGELCSNNQCTELGKNRGGKPIFTTGDGNAIYSQLGEAFVKIDQLTNSYSKPRVGQEAGLEILDSMQAHK